MIECLERTCKLVAGNRGFASAATELQEDTIVGDWFEDRIRPAMERLLDRARSAGAVRPEIAAVDVYAAMTMVHAVADLTGPVDSRTGDATWHSC
ncbi:hypothetical protein AB0L97_37005 [Nocardia sp. NPDC051911]|uniref:SbtR family transcriptional regulator n=1 Tax=Nocardia sp. NPDC051911 TaxID=3154648 RepID=UPI00343D5C26